MFKSGLGRSSPNGIHQMYLTADVPGLVEYLDKVNYDHIPDILMYLTRLSEIGWFDRIISHGAIPKAVSSMGNGSQIHKRCALYLIYSIITQGRGDIVLATDGAIENMLKALDEEEEESIDRGVAYCMAMICPLGGAETFIRNGGIEKIAPLVRSDDELTVLYTLYTLNAISSMGYQMEILETKVNQYISYHMPDNPEIEKLSQMLLDDLYNWREEDFILDMDELEIIETGIKLPDSDERYTRPMTKKQRIEPRDGTILGYDGKEIKGRDHREVVIELKRRRLEKMKKKITGEPEKKEEKKGIEAPKEMTEVKAPQPPRRMVRQRVVKARPEIKLDVERKVINVTSGSLDDVLKDLKSPVEESVLARTITEPGMPPYVSQEAKRPPETNRGKRTTV